MHETSLEALSMLRDPSHFSWYVIPLFAMVVYTYFVEIGKKNWNLVLAALAIWGTEWCLEVINALFLHFTQYSAVWTEVGPTAYLIFVGVNIETTFMFAMMGIVFCRVLPEDRNMKILGIDNRLFLTFGYSIFCVFIEVLLNQIGVLVWNYWWWNFPNVWLIIIFGYSLYYFIGFHVFDTESWNRKIGIVGGLWGAAILSTILFVSLGWI